MMKRMKMMKNKKHLRNRKHLHNVKYQRWFECWSSWRIRSGIKLLSQRTSWLLGFVIPRAGIGTKFGGTVLGIFGLINGAHTHCSQHLIVWFVLYVFLSFLFNVYFLTCCLFLFPSRSPQQDRNIITSVEVSKEELSHNQQIEITLNPKILGVDLSMQCQSHVTTRNFLKHVDHR